VKNWYNNGPELDIAVDPLEGTNFAANNLPGALSVIALLKKIIFLMHQKHIWKKYLLK
jgi:fructose-1,6-bisphosphatase/sedoheptulose 1,7-bisphosphatase-like protein